MPILFQLNVSTGLKGTRILAVWRQLKLARTSSKVKFFFRSFDISRNILRNQKTL